MGIDISRVERLMIPAEQLLTTGIIPPYAEERGGIRRRFAQKVLSGRMSLGPIAEVWRPAQRRDNSLPIAVVRVSEKLTDCTGAARSFFDHGIRELDFSPTSFRYECGSKEADEIVARLLTRFANKERAFGAGLCVGNSQCHFAPSSTHAMGAAVDRL